LTINEEQQTTKINRSLALMKKLGIEILYSRQIAQSTKTIKSMLDKALLINQ